MIKFNWIAVACIGLLFLTSGARIAVPTQQFTTLTSLGVDNAGPNSALVQAAGGKLYGTGTLSGHGSVFTITSSGMVTTLLLNGANGSAPGSGLIQGTDGNFYGSAVFGGANGFGTVFMVTPNGTPATLYSFCPQVPCTDGSLPYGGLVQASDANFYGTTGLGGHSGNGTVFKITSGGTLTTLYRFIGTDGARPVAALVQGSDGDLYGTTLLGGPSNIGTIFKITTSGELTTLHSFTGLDGSKPFASLVQGTDGNFYGNTSSGGSTGCGSGCGTIFKITPSGTFTMLHEFGVTDGSSPKTALIEAKGNLYGTTFGGGAANEGTIFKITPRGTFTTIYSFCSQSGCPDGKIPYGLVQNTNGKIYGTTYQGGENDDGTVYNLTLGLQPFVKTLPLAGTVGAAVRILGTDLTGASSVTFNGIQATFKVKSGTNIEATVPVGATTGTVQVVTPQRTLSSNIPFQVLP